MSNAVAWNAPAVVETASLWARTLAIVVDLFVVSVEQWNDLQQQQEKADPDNRHGAARGTSRKGQGSIPEPQVDEAGQPEQEENPNQQPIEGARLQPPYPATPACARCHWLQGSHVGREANQPRE